MADDRQALNRFGELGLRRPVYVVVVLALAAGLLGDGQRDRPGQLPPGRAQGALRTPTASMSARAVSLAISTETTAKASTTTMKTAQVEQKPYRLSSAVADDGSAPPNRFGSSVYVSVYVVVVLALAVVCVLMASETARADIDAVGVRSAP